MSLPAPDIEYLERRGLSFEVVQSAGAMYVLFPSWTLPPGLSHASADLLLRLQPGYPDLAPDMWWFSPGLTLAGGAKIQATESVESHIGRTWQRWSRHFQSGQWKPGVDGLESYLTLIDRELRRAAGIAA